jgi:hypothetical protein
MIANFETITLTWGDVCENGPGMQKIGNLDKRGYSVGELEKMKEKFEEKGVVCEMIDLGEEVDEEVDEAKVLIMRGGVKAMLKENSLEDFYNEQCGLDVDKKVFMRGKVKNKLARYNLCFGHESQEPNYEEKKGRVIKYEDVKCLDEIRGNMVDFFGEKADNLYCEGNYYYDLKKCGIGWHGDGERRKVIGMRLGKSMNLNFSWFKKFYSVGKVVEIVLNDGDMYVMSEKSVGFDWKKSSIFTLRHAGGLENSKYLKLKVEEKKVEEKKVEEKELDFEKEKEIIRLLIRDMKRKDKKRVLKELYAELSKK